MLEHDFRHERAGLQIAAPLELEHVAFGADHGAVGELFEQRTRAGRSWRALRKAQSPHYRTLRRADQPQCDAKCRARDMTTARRVRLDQPRSHLEHLPQAPAISLGNAMETLGVHPAQPAGHRRADARARFDRQRRRRLRDPDRRAAGHRDHAEPARRRHGALSRLDRDDDPVDRVVRRADSAAVEDRPGHRLPAGGHRRDALRAAADRSQHVHGDPQPRSRAALGRDRHGHVAVAAAAARRDSRSRCR